MAKTADLRERHFTVKEFAEALNISIKTARRRIKSGDLPVVRTGRIVRIRPEDYRRYVADLTKFG